MLTEAFLNGEALRSYCQRNSIPIWEAMIQREMKLSEQPREALLLEMQRNLEVMREAVQEGLEFRNASVSGLSGGDAEMLYRYAKLDPFSGTIACRAAASAMAVVEVNAAMGRIVAAPTAGASGILTGVLIESAKRRNWSDEQLVRG
ncbi:MAG: L-serine ammonia-lyase, iron-sulfur-dependent, subunit alpha, partial [Clostridia bacterium]|nr:L-serine ammonia-lyase, iron-sulfur-dependent, subunit alpha [Clostridia bacterium]